LLPLEGVDYMHWGVQRDGYDVDAMLAEGSLSHLRGNCKYRHEQRRKQTPAA
jgi:hypothetical protein